MILIWRFGKSCQDHQINLSHYWAIYTVSMGFSPYSNKIRQLKNPANSVIWTSCQIFNSPIIPLIQYNVLCALYNFRPGSYSQDSKNGFPLVVFMILDYQECYNCTRSSIWLLYEVFNLSCSGNIFTLPTNFILPPVHYIKENKRLLTALYALMLVYFSIIWVE